MDVDDLIASAAPRTEVVRVCARGDLVTLHLELTQQLNEQVADQGRSLGGNPEIGRLSQAILDVEAEQEAATLTLKLASVTARQWANLLRKHPPTKAQRSEGADHNHETFQPATVAACCVEPDLSPLQADRLFDTLPEGEWNRIWMVVMGLNVLGLPSPKLAAASELLQASEASSGTPVPLASPEESSLGGSGEPSPPTDTTETV